MGLILLMLLIMMVLAFFLDLDMSTRWILFTEAFSAFKNRQEPFIESDSQQYRFKLMGDSPLKANLSL